MLINKTDREFISQSIKENFSSIYLKRWTIRVRKALMRKSEITPHAFKLITTSGKKFKLLITHMEAAESIELILKNYKIIENLEISPRIVAYNKKIIIAEFIDGVFPKFEDDKFVLQLSKIIAELNQINFNYINKKFFFDKFNKEYEILRDLIPSNINLFSYFNNELPDKIPTGFTYGDHNLENYIFKNNKIKLIDFGSFVNNEIIDVHLVSSVMYQEKINKNLFKENYLKYNSNNFLFENFKLLQIYSLLKIASVNRNKYFKVPFYDWRLRNNRKRNYTWAINTMISIFNQNDQY